ncbi:RlpA-like double-psi beta-barrel-protein domain-containing protein-containing protein [Elsinoe ampelina]|uniref:RlpA-like double-psi beta-barrel-protein domain-containing protein-containing protein n=1 Tax=Elsinoe ampelina TaxID=302913 RepID=A0A6A6G0P5_9PEZI|nr:RlpA-like double-psi beta-barrel-protein domain-containing protein-containing protein [Elsinoe ampelina]
MFSVLSLTLLVTSLLPFTTSLTLATRQSSSARGTFYGGNLQGGTCSFSTYTLPSGVYGTALSGASWASSGNCGGCVAVTGPNGKTITAMIVDQCPECPANGLDLFQNAFAQLADISKGVISLNWKYVTCPISSPLQIHLKSGVSQYWFSAQVVNGKRRTSKMEVSTDAGKSYKAVPTRQTYNFFELSSGLGKTTAWVRVTSETGSQVVVKDVPMTGDKVVTAGANYA